VSEFRGPLAEAIEILARQGRGNIDLTRQPRVLNPDGSISTVRSMSANFDGEEVLIPTTVGGRVVSDEEAIQEYLRTRRHLGKFKTPQEATAYADQLHNDYAAGRYDRGSPNHYVNGALMNPAVSHAPDMGLIRAALLALMRERR
jgi:hypothetical protein